MPVLFSSHQLDLVERLCDDLVILADGRLVAAGSVEELAGCRRRPLPGPPRRRRADDRHCPTYRGGGAWRPQRHCARAVRRAAGGGAGGRPRPCARGRVQPDPASAVGDLPGGRCDEHAALVAHRRRARGSHQDPRQVVPRLLLPSLVLIVLGFLVIGAVSGAAAGEYEVALGQGVDIAITESAEGWLNASGTEGSEITTSRPDEVEQAVRDGDGRRRPGPPGRGVPDHR